MTVSTRVMQAAINDFNSKLAIRKKAEADWIHSLPTLEQAIRIGGESIDRRGKRQSHQARRKKETIAKVTQILVQNEADITRSKDFDDVYLWVDKLVGDLSDVGDLYVYDIAYVIATKMGFEAVYVYLHRGTADGAACFDVSRKLKKIKPSDLPPPLSLMKADDLEDILCIFKGAFKTNRLPDGREETICFANLRELNV